MVCPPISAQMRGRTLARPANERARRPLLKEASGHERPFVRPLLLLHSCGSLFPTAREEDHGTGRKNTTLVTEQRCGPCPCTCGHTAQTGRRQQASQAAASYYTPPLATGHLSTYPMPPPQAFIPLRRRPYSTRHGPARQPSSNSPRCPAPPPPRNPPATPPLATKTTQPPHPIPPPLWLRSIRRQPCLARATCCAACWPWPPCGLPAARCRPARR